MAIVIDTDVVSFIFKKDSRAELYEQHLDGQFMFLSFVTLAELRFWSLVSKWGTRRLSEFETHLRRYSIQHSTPEICRLWSQITYNGRQSGYNIAPNDAFVAAAALFFNVPLVTHNASDFAAVQGLITISES